MNRKEEDKWFKSMCEYKVKCQCSHVILIPRADRAMCSHCGNWVYRTPQLKFKYKIKEQLIKEAKNDN